MNTPPDFSALERAFARQHSQVSRIKDVLRGLDSDLYLELPVEALHGLAEATDATPPPAPPSVGMRA
jgi:hypothetical protein